MDTKTRIKKLTILAILLSMALVLSIVESFIPFGIPGVKLGLANLIILLAIYYFGFWIPLAIDLARVFIASIATGTFLGMGFVMSLAGALASFLLMYVFVRWLKCFTSVGASIIGAYTHALAQIIIGVIYMNSWGILYYFPVMAAVALLTGTLNGIIVEVLLNNSYLNRVVDSAKGAIQPRSKK